MRATRVVIRLLRSLQLSVERGVLDPALQPTSKDVTHQPIRGCSGQHFAQRTLARLISKLSAFVV